MVSKSCKMIVKIELEKLDINYKKVHLGKVVLQQELTSLQVQNLSDSLSKYGLEIIYNQEAILVEKIKNAIMEFVLNQDMPKKTKKSDYLSQHLHYNYTYLANVFSSNMGITIERFCILLKIEKVKEFLSYGELTLSEIAYLLGYNSLSHLSSQFKKITGICPTKYKNSKKKKRYNLEDM